MMQRMFDRVARDLDLSDDQNIRFHELIEARRDQLDAMRERWREAAEARREEGDGPPPADMRRRMMNFEGPDAVLEEVLDELAPDLDDAQLDRLDEIQNRMAEQRERRDTMRRMTVELPDELGFDDEQRAAHEAIVQRRGEEFGERMREMRDIGRQLRDAEEAGDATQAEELRTRMEELRRDPSEMVSGFLDELAPILHDDQRTAFEQVRAEFAPQPTGGADAAPAKAPSLRNVLRAARRARPEAAQRDQMKTIEKDAMQESKRIPRTDHAGQSALVERVIGQLHELFNEDQNAAFDKQLERLRTR